MAVALITGASRGFGRALARSLALDGWSLVLDARGAPALELVTTELAQLTERASAIAGDVTDRVASRARSSPRRKRSAASTCS